MYHRRIAVMTAGGDSPGMNAAIRAIVVKAIEYGFEVLGIKRGWMGLLNEQIEDLDINSVSEILPLGGTILGTSRHNPLKQPDGEKKSSCQYRKK
jgi:6-phosphofructokinase 1